MVVKKLSNIARSILKEHISLVKDVGDAPFSLIRELLLLPSISAEQLHELESNSPHLYPDTEEIWKVLCMKDSVAVKAAVEDGVMTKPPSTWRDLHAEEMVKREIRMAGVRAKMRGQYHEARDGRATTKEVDGIRAEKRRKLNSGGSSRPKLSLIEKARQNSRRISAIYAPKRHSQSQVQTLSVPTLQIPRSSSGSKSKSTQPKVITVTKIVKVPVSRSPESGGGLQKMPGVKRSASGLPMRGLQSSPVTGRAMSKTGSRTIAPISFKSLSSSSQSASASSSSASVSASVVAFPSSIFLPRTKAR